MYKAEIILREALFAFALAETVRANPPAAAGQIGWWEFEISELVELRLYFLPAGSRSGFRCARHPRTGRTSGGAARGFGKWLGAMLRGTQDVALPRSACPGMKRWKRGFGREWT
jgi:hypothetical protein